MNSPLGEQSDDPTRPLTRREAIALEAAQSRRKAPRKPAQARRVAPRKAASEKPRSTRGVAARAGSVLVMACVAGVTIATSVPADALLSPEDVEARAIAAQSEHVDHSHDQILDAALQAAEQTVEQESYDSASIAEYAAASGLRVADTFVNNPKGTVQWPFAVGVTIGDLFGSTWGRSSAHRGLDFNPGNGAPIQAIADGVVTLVDTQGSLGEHIMITHNINGETITSVYAHLIYGSTKFKVGDAVKVGDIIGNVGDTGYSTGPHLHFEIRLGDVNGQQVDPLPWLRANTN